jgi:hypothetical protein
MEMFRKGKNSNRCGTETQENTYITINSRREKGNKV